MELLSVELFDKTEVSVHKLIYALFSSSFSFHFSEAVVASDQDYHRVFVI